MTLTPSHKKRGKTFNWKKMKLQLKGFGQGN